MPFANFVSTATCVNVASGGRNGAKFISWHVEMLHLYGWFVKLAHVVIQPESAICLFVVDV